MKLITKEGLKKLEEELNERQGKIRQEIARAIKEAKEQGDLSENAEYSEAKRQQSENESKIAILESMIKNSQIVEDSGSTDGFVRIGSDVGVKFNNKEVTFHIVGASEADPSNYRISNESPLGKALLGKKKGDVTKVETPTGAVKYSILSVK
ncbi:MAG: Transcription elongation factor GreA [Candidatus Moranbacteria bacterium GW2011_GWF2_34_56]|nr:MAG: Transcription elongation factor GreA [Candidatus Moranbacteria bacterium GW2011_GWF1_34_10]KKP64461.1 MAG: Transcription elongation factor GreA [Candidatus Moranbacteria bacterium GW2011_GWF2_34_56]HBI17108.1 transcription elongation factor GreA [Candidatus Moranbacteria bacterium]